MATLHKMIIMTGQNKTKASKLNSSPNIYHIGLNLSIYILYGLSFISRKCAKINHIGGVLVEPGSGAYYRFPNLFKANESFLKLNKCIDLQLKRFLK